MSHLITTTPTSPSVVTKSGNYTLTAADDTVIATGIAKTLTLPDATTVPNKKYTIKNGVGTATILASAGGTIDGAATLTSALVSAYGVVRVFSDGTNWYAW